MDKITLFYATGNKSKLHNMRYRLRNYPIHIICPTDLSIHLEVEESGSSAVENATLKAKAYSEKISFPVIAGDTGLTISGIPESEQPGLYVRRVNGAALTDDEMIEYYSGLARKASQDCFLHYVTGVALITENGMFTTEIRDAPLKLSASPNANRRHRGNPLDVISQTQDGRYYNELSDEERIALEAEGERKFTDFILNHLLSDKTSMFFCSCVYEQYNMEVSSRRKNGRKKATFQPHLQG